MEARARLAGKTGRSAEDAAAAFLESIGFRVIERNFRVRMGEIDLVCRDGNTTVFVEVKARSNVSHGRAVEFVSAVKVSRIKAAAKVFAARNRLTEAPLRFDVISFDNAQFTNPRHDRGAF